MTLSARLSLAFILTLTAGSAQAQGVDMDQIPRREVVISPPGGQLVDPMGVPANARHMEQVGTASGNRAGAGQLVPATAARQAPAQVNRERGNVRPAAQLYQGGRTAQPADPLSSPSQGRPQTVVRLKGDDRCDRDLQDAALRKTCANAIETRSAEFERNNPLILSPEQRLLVDQRMRDQPASAQAAVQRIGKNDVDAGSMDAQNVASLVLVPGKTAEPASTGTLGADSAADPSNGSSALIQAIVEGVRNSTPR